MPPIPKSIKLAILDDYQGVTKSIFAPLASHFEITYFPDTLLPFNHPDTPENVKQELITRLKPFTVISSMRERTPFPAPLLKELPNLKLLLTTSKRNRGIDLDAAKSLGITVTGTTGNPMVGKKTRQGPDSTTQHCIALILGLARCIASDDLNVKSGLWQTTFATGLSGKNFTTLGLGRLGGSVAKIMYESFGMNILCWSASLTQEKADEKAKELGLPTEDEDGDKVFKAVSKEEAFKEGDVVSVHYLLSERSRGLVAAEDFALMKPSALFINSSRGPIVDDDSMFDALTKGKIRGAALDVFEVEPLAKESRWRTTKWGKDGKSQVLLSPHMGYVEEGTMTRWYEEQGEILEKWLKGEELMNVMT